MLRPSAPEKGSNSPVCTAGYRNEEGCPAEGGGGGGMTAVLRVRFFRTFLVVGMFALLFPFVLLSSSSEAEDIAPWRSALDLDRLWSGALGCADAGNDEEAVTNALAGDSVPGGVQRDYLDCGTRALRAAASRILVDTIEDSLRWGGLYAFDQEFRLESNLAWEFGGDFRGELDTILPVGGELHSDGTGRALFLQQGITFWEGGNNELRSDSNTGLVYRGHVSRDWILGGSFFFDYNFQREHSRLSVGVDAQSKNFYGGLNYYFTPSGREWRRGRTGYEERVLEGWDLRWSFTWEQLRLSGAFGTWIFDGEGPGRRQSVSVSAGYMVYPGVFLETGYEYHDDRSVDEDWNLGLAFRYSLPEMEGIGGRIGGGRVPDLWRIVDRERRILYEERLSRARVSATLATTPNIVEEGEGVTVRVVLGEVLEEDVFFSVAAVSGSTAEADDYGPLPSRMMIPAGAMSAEETFWTVDDSDSEPAENLDLELKVLQESFFSVSRGNPHHARVVIGASDNSIVGFAAESTSVTEGIKVDIPLKLGEPAPSGGFVLVTSSDKEEEVTLEASMEIVEGAHYGQYVRVTVNDDGYAELAEMVQITLDEPPGGLPEGWWIDRREHMLIIQPHDLNIAFALSSSEANEDVGSVNLDLVLNESAPAEMVLALGSSSPTDAAPVNPMLQVPAGARRVTFPVRITSDNIGEGSETVTISVTESSPFLPEGWSIGSPDTHELTLVDDDLFVGFKHSSSQVHENDSLTDIEITLGEIGAPDGGMNLTVTAEGNEDNDISFATLVPVSAGEKEKTLRVTIAQDNLPEGAERIVLTLSGELPESWNYGQKTHELTILPNDQTAMFAEAGRTVKENDGTVKFKVTLSENAPVGGVPLEVAITSGNDDGDVTFTTQRFRIAYGEREHEISVIINDDNQVEREEVVRFTLSKGGSFPQTWGDLGAQTTFDLTITDDDSATIGFTTSSTTLLESDTTGAVLTIRLNGSVSQNVEVTLSESGDGNEDITSSPVAPATLTFTPGETEKQVGLAVNSANGDALPEGDVEITYTLTGMLLDNVNFANRQHVVTLVDDDKTIRFKDSSSIAKEGTTGHPVAVVLNFNPPVEGLEVSAVATGDHRGDVSISSPILNFTGGTRELSLPVDVLEDNIREDAEIVQLELEETATPLPTGWTLLASDDNDHDLTILPNDQEAMFAEAGRTVNENDGTVKFKVTLSEDAPAGGVPLEVAITSGNDDGDVTFTTQRFRVAYGEREHEISVIINDDNQVEREEAVRFTLSKDASTTFPDAWGDLGTQTTFDITITDDDSSTIGFMTASSTLSEGETSPASLTVSLSAAVSQEVVVDLTESGDGNNDLEFAPTSLTFTPGETDKQVTLTVNASNNDNKVEEDVDITYTLTGSLPEDVSFAGGRHVVTFMDDDSATVGFTEATSTLSESDSTANLTLELSAEVSQDVVVMLTESGDGNDDLTFSSTSLTFAPGETSKQVTLTVTSVNDNQVEEDVEITYTLTGTLPDDVSFTGDRHVVTFMDDDSSTVGFASGSSILREGDGTSTLSVVLTNPVSQDVIVTLSESGDTNNEVAFPPDSVTFASGETSKEITLTVEDDNRVESGATITYTLAGTLPDNLDVSFGTRDHVVTFIDDDSSTVGFASGSSTLRENEGTATLSVVLSNPVSEDVVIALSESGDTNDEVAFSPASLTFAAGQTSKEITLTVVDDNIVEPGATITYTLTGSLPYDVSLGTDNHVVTFMDDDSAAIGFTSSSSTLSEGDSATKLMVMLSAEVSWDVMVTLTESGDDDNQVVFTPPSLTFTPGQTSKEVDLTVVDDDTVEEDVTITYTLAGTLLDDVTFGIKDHEVTFTDDDSATVGFTSSSSTLNESDSTDILTVSLSAPVAQEIVVDLTESGDDNNDLTFSSSSLTFAPGETNKQVTLTVNASNNDNQVEEDVEITYTLTGTLPDDVSLGTANHVVTLMDDDSSEVGFASGSMTLRENEGTAILRVVLSNPVSEDVVIALSESGDDGNEVTFEPETLTFAPGETNKQVTLTVVDDNTVEPGATITYTLAGTLPDNLDVSFGTREHVVTFVDDDSATVGFASSSSTLNESDSTGTLTVLLSAPVAQNVVLALTESGDDNDLTFSSSSLTFAPGETNKQVTLTVNASNNDNQVEEDVEITYTLTGTLPDDVSLGTANHVVTLMDDDSATVGFTSSSSTLSEGDSTATLSVLLTNPVSEDVVVTLTESGDTNNEVTFSPDSVTFASGETSKEITLTVEDDNRVESDATITYTLAGTLPDNLDVSFGTRDHVVTFIDDDSSTVGFASGSSTLRENEGTATLSVVLSNPVSKDVVVALTESGDDDNQVAFSPASLTFAAGQTSKEITLTVVDDNTVEEDATITYTLAGTLLDDVTFGIKDHVVTFTDDDSSTVGFMTTSSTLNESDSTGTLTVLLSAPVAQEVVVDLTESGDGNNDLEFAPTSLTFAPGDTNKQVTLTVEDDNNDNKVEEDVEITYTLTGSLPDDVSFAEGRHVVTFMDDDSATVGFASGSSTLREGDGTATLRVELTNPVSEDVVLALSESGDESGEVSFTPNSLTFASGETSHNVTLTVVDDNTVEPGATITYTLTGSLPDDVSLDTQEHVVTFIDDDSATVGFTTALSTLSEDGSTANLTVELSDEVSQSVEVTLSESGDNNNDLIISPETLTFAPGETDKQVTLTVNTSNNDSTVEEDVGITYTLTGSLPDDVSFVGDRHVVTFADDDSSEVGFASGSSTLRENEGTSTLTVVLTNPVSQDVIVTLSESGDTNNEVAFPPDSVTFVSGETSKEITLTVEDDNNVEPGATITYTLAGTLPDNLDVSFGTREHVVTFIDDDSSTIGFTRALSTLSEGDSTTNLTVELSAPSTQLVTVTLTESGDDNNDLEFAPTSLTFAPGEKDKQVTLTVTSVNDNQVEEDVEITYTLTGTFSGNVSLDASRSTHVVTFMDDDSATVGFTSSSSTLREDETGTASLTVSLSAEVSQEVVVDLTESGDGNNDLTFSPSSLTFAPGETSHDVTLTVNASNNDNQVEEDATITYTLTGTLPDDVTLSTREHVVTFTDDDKTISFKDSSSGTTEGTIGHPVAVVLNFDPPAEGLEISAVTKGEHKDDVSIPSPTLNFTGNTRELFVSVDVLDDIEQEDAEVVQLELEETSTSLPEGWTLIASGDNDHDLTIEPNDQAAMFAEADKMVNEDAGTVSFRVALSADAPVGGVNLEVAITSGNEDGDVTFTTQNFTIAEGGREHTLTVDINDDNLVEQNEVVRFTLSKGGSFPQTWGDLGTQTTFDLIILANDGSVAFVNASSIAEEDSGEALLVLDVTGVPPTDGLPMRVEIAGHSTSATTDDYTFDPLTFTLVPEEAAEDYNLIFSITDDDLPEEDEIFTVTLHAGEGFPNSWGGLGEQRTHDLTILANDRTIGFADTLPAEIEEGADDLLLEIAWNAQISGSISLGVVLEKADDGDNQNDVTLSSLNEMITEYNTGTYISRTYSNFPAGSSRRLTIRVPDDMLPEEDEEVIVRLVPREGSSLPDGWSINPAEYRFTIPANDNLVGFESSGGLNLVEGASENIVLKLNAPAPVGGLNLVVSVNEETDDEGDNIDVNVTTGAGSVLAVPAGGREVLLPVMAVDDNIPEGDEPVLLTLSKGANWPEGWEIGGSSTGGGFSATHAVTILGNDKKVGWREATRKLVREGNTASVSRIVTNYPAPAGGFSLTLETVPYTGSYAQADIPDDISFVRSVRIPENSRIGGGVGTVLPIADEIAEPDEAAWFRLSIANGGQLPPGWEWSNQQLEVIILANDNDFTFTDQNGNTKGSFSEGDTVRLTAVVTNTLPPLMAEEYYATFRTRVNYFGIAVTENSDDITITPVAPVIYHPNYRNPDGSLTENGMRFSQPLDESQTGSAKYAFTVTEGDLDSLAFDVLINEDSETEPPETVVITLSISGSWGMVPTTQHYTLTVNDEGGTGMVGFSQAEIDKGPYGLFEEATLGQQNPGVVVELSSPAPAGGIDLVLKSSHPNEFFVGGIVHIQQHLRRCYVKLSQLSGDGNGGNYHFPEHRERCYFVDFNVKADGDPEPDETYEIIISEDSNLPPKWGIDSNRSRREVTIYSNDNGVGIAGFIDPQDNSIKKTVSVDESVSGGKVSLVLNVPNDPGPGHSGLPPGLHLRLNVNPLTADANSADIGNFISQDFTIPRRNQEGSFQHVIDIPITNDSDAEQLESFSFRLNFQSRGTAHNTWGSVDSRNNTATLRIHQSDQKVGFTEDPLTITEGSTRDTFIVSSIPLPSPMTLRFVVKEIHGTLDRFEEGDPASDEITIVSEQTFPAGSSRFRFPIEALEDSIAETDEMFIVRADPISVPAGFTLVPAGTRVIIPENDNLVGFTNVATEVNEDVGTVNVTLTLTNPAPAGGLPLRIPPLATASPGSSFAFTEYGNEFIIMPEDELQYTFTVNIDNDNLAENTEIYNLVLEKGQNFPDGWGTLSGQATHGLTILESDQKISWAEESVEIVEGEEKSLVLNFPSSIPNDAPAGVSFRTENNSDGDISFPPSEVRISGAQPSYRLRVTANDDMEKEDDETFMIVATGRDFPPSYAQDQEATIEVTVPANNNNLVGFVGSNIEVNEDVGSINLTLNLTGDTPPSGLHMRLNISGAHPADIGGTVSHDFTIPRRNQEESFQHVIEIPITDDDIPEHDERITFRLDESETEEFDNSWGKIDSDNNEFVLTIRGHDQWISFHDISFEVAEGTTGYAYLHFSSPVPHPVTFMIHTDDPPIDGVNFASALTVEEDDYEMRDLGLLTVIAWKIPITVDEDEISEGEQSFTLFVTPGPELPDYYVREFLDVEIIIPESD